MRKAVTRPLGHGKIDDGMFNLHDKMMGGHIHFAPCNRAAFLRRKLFGMEARRSKSITSL